MLQKIVRQPLIPSENAPVLVLIHGLGSDEHDLMGLSPELDPRLLIVTVRAPHPYEFGGYAWFDVTLDEAGVHADEDGAVKSRDLLLTELSGLPRELGFEPRQLFLGGFSQGGMMTLGVVLNSPQLLAGAVVLSGRLLPKFVPPTLPDELRDLPILIQHGSEDQVLPVAGGREARTFLEEAGSPVTYTEYPMGHDISVESLGQIRSWLSNLIV
jgi:phospholipase/carboxylesterase